MQSILPSHAQAALALAIIRSKPSQCPIGEYMLQLRHHTRSGRDPTRQPQAGQYLDLVEYWQDQYKRMQDECNRLRILNVKLERSNHLLASRGQENSTLPPPSPKRRKGAPLMSKQPKRARPTQENSAEQKLVEMQVVIDSDSDFLDTLGEDGAHLTEALFNTHNLCRATTSDADGLCFSLVRTSSALGKVIHIVAQNHEQLSRQARKTVGSISLDQDKSGFAMALSACARAFMSVLVGIRRLAESSADDRLPNLIVCELAAMFKSGLISIEITAQQAAQTFLLHPVEPKGKSKGLANVPKDAIPARGIAHLLISFLGFLDKREAIHQNIFDAFAIVLLERVGRQLYYCTFGRHRSASMEGMILPMSASHDPTQTAKQELEAVTTRFEVKALVLVLERAMGLATSHMNPHPDRPSTNSNRPSRTMSFKNLPTSSRVRLSPLARERLQRTLIACMYGDKTDDEFLDVLSMPIPTMQLSSLKSASKVEDKNVADWYKQEVWRLIGWDVLAHDRGW